MVQVESKNSLLQSIGTIALCCLISTAAACGSSESTSSKQAEVKKNNKVVAQKLGTAPADSSKVELTEEAKKAIAENSKPSSANLTLMEDGVQTPTIEEDVTLDRVKNETSEALAVADAFLRQQEQKYHKKIDVELANFSDRVSKLRNRAESAASEAKQRVTKQLADLRSQMTVTGAQLGDFNKKSQNQLDSLSSELQQLLSVLEASEQTEKASEMEVSSESKEKAEGDDV